MTEWPRDCRIRNIVVYGPVGKYGESETYRLGHSPAGEPVEAVTELRPIVKSGGYSDIPYVQVWCGKHLYAEFCQHRILGVYFAVEGETP